MLPVTLNIEFTLNFKSYFDISESDFLPFFHVLGHTTSNFLPELALSEVSYWKNRRWKSKEDTDEVSVLALRDHDSDKPCLVSTYLLIMTHEAILYVGSGVLGF